MRGIIIALSALMLFGGVASADRWRRGRDTSNHSGGTVVRDHRSRDSVRVDRGYRRGYDRSYNRGYQQRVRVDRRPVYVNNGRFGPYVQLGESPE